MRCGSPRLHLVVTAIDGSDRLARLGIRVWLRSEGVGDGGVEVLLPEQSRSVASGSGGSDLVWIDAVRSSPDGDITEQLGTDGAPWIDPGRLDGGLSGIGSHGVGEVGDEL